MKRDEMENKETFVELSSSALSALLAEGGSADAERWAACLAERLCQHDTATVAGMLAATEGTGPGGRLAARLEAGSKQGAALADRLRRYESLARSAAPAPRPAPRAADDSARTLLLQLEELFQWLEAPPLDDLDSLAEISLTTPEGRNRALAAAKALREALLVGPQATSASGGGLMPAARLGAVRERLRRLARARDGLAANIARHLNNLLIHLGNTPLPQTPTGAIEAESATSHHAALLPYSGLMAALRDMDSRAHATLSTTYCTSWARLYTRAVKAAAEHARSQLAASPESVATHLDNVLSLVEKLCNAEQDFCTQFFNLDAELKNDASSETDSADRTSSSGGGGGGESRRFMRALFPCLDADGELVTLIAHIDKMHPYGAMRALACISRRVLDETDVAGNNIAALAAGSETRWWRLAGAAGAVAAKRAADRLVTERIEAMPDSIRQASRRNKCGIVSLVGELEATVVACEEIFDRARRADVERWYCALGQAALTNIARAEHPRTPSSAVLMENYHRLHAVLSALRVSALEPTRREARARYTAALSAYVASELPRPLDRLAAFFDGVNEAVAAGVKETEVCYRAAFSKQELKRILAMYPAQEVRKSLSRVYKTADKQLSSEGGLLQVVWREFQQEFLRSHHQLQERIAACYPGAGLALPLTTDDILAAFSDIAREH